VLASFDEREQLLEVPIIEGTGQGMTKAVERRIEEKVVGMCCDTKASNTGKDDGACRKLKKLSEQKLLNLECKHHMYEIVLRGVFDSLLGPTSSGSGYLSFQTLRRFLTRNLKEKS